MDSGKWIRGLREQLFVKPSDVERITRVIATRKGNPDFYVSHSTLADIEAGSIPSIYKLFSLAVCLRIPLSELFLPFGIDPGETNPPPVEPSADAIAAPNVNEREPAFHFHLNFDTKVSAEETTLLRFQPREIEGLPTFFQARFNPARYRYAVIGSQDDVMWDVLPPRSLVEVDTDQNTVQVFAWRTIRQRPIYLVWHTEGHTCSWCQVDGKELILLPHPLSRRPARRFKMPSQATVVGRVTNAWLPFEQFQLD